MSGSIRVLLADDQPLVRSGLRVLMADTPDMEVVGEAANGAEAVRLTAELDPDVVVMDIRMPEMDGIEATRRITAGRPGGRSGRGGTEGGASGGTSGGARVLILTTFDEDDHVYGALRAGASGFAVKDMALDDILAAVRVVAAGDSLLAPGVTRRLIADFAAAPAPAPERVPVVTEREQEVLTLVGRGLSNSEIAETLFISIATAKSHVARLLTKLDARDRVQLVIKAYEMGLVSPPG
ncbi:response regulator transcription factor [Streptomyces sp. NPDC047718]|uniref:response regulator transcription factor n=1 Tax=Streptomyces sp. NPDC047718 TaxID=3155479 RepID=UPI0033C2770D